jgi:sulfite oxidase
MRSIGFGSRRRFLQGSAAIAAAAALGGRRAAFAAEQDLIVRSADPLNAEPRLLALVADALTPAKHFYVRNHGPIPKVEAKDYKLRIEGMVGLELELSLAQIKERFPQVTVESTLTCAGNRRQEMSAIKPVGGVQWDAGAIGHARWTGVRLSDVLRAAFVEPAGKYVWFEGADLIKEKDGSVAPFGGSIPLEKTFTAIRVGKGGRIADSSDSRTPIIAHSMNDEPLTAEHGAPLRMVVPGYIGARSVKWLSKITVSDRASPNHYVAEAYKVIQNEDKDEVARAEPIYGFPVNAAICSPAAGAMVKAGKTLVGGYALPSGDEPATIAKVEISRDGGRSWAEAQLFGKAAPFCWQQWTAEVELSPGKHELVVCATDSRGNMTPEKAEWNFKGYLYNGWHRVAVEAV